MKLTKINMKVKCDIGGCGKDAALLVRSERTGAHTGIYLCRDCARELARELGKAGKGERE